MEREKEKKSEPIDVHVTQQELVPYIVKQGKLLHNDVKKARVKYGPRYNRKNSVEEMYQKFGNPMDEKVAERFAQEFFLILQKKSTLPASVRNPVRDICQAAMNQCYLDKLVALNKKKEEEAKSQEK